MLARCEQVCAIVDGMRQDIASNSLEEGCKEGMLIGKVDSYLISFDGQVNKMKAQLARSRDHWTARSSANNEDFTRKVAAVLAS